MFLVDMYSHFVEGLQRARTARMANSLPPEIQKDIGWPGYYPEGNSRYVGAPQRWR